MKTYQLLKIILIATFVSNVLSYQVKAQNTESVTNNNNNNENVDIDVQEAGSQQQGQGQSANSGTSSVTVTDEDAKDNFWTNGSRTQLVVPEGNASLSCGEQMISFSRSGGLSLGVLKDLSRIVGDTASHIGAASINSSDNQGQLPDDFKPSLTAIQQCAKQKNIAEVLQQYLQLAQVDLAIAQTYLRIVSPEVYATLFVENAKDKREILSEQLFNNLAANLRNEEFERVVEWQDSFYGAALAKERVKFEKNQELQVLERNKRLTELEVLELKRTAQEVEAIIRYQQSELNRSLERYQQQN
ncbi:MAG: hypothetical protein KME09_11450 [Pleurocapsa minor HA4230-MV1]|jgi:hypothetical protein|nr:hypothetical protein [Pleurocapsa minor HA4230-MV1]